MLSHHDHGCVVSCRRLVTTQGQNAESVKVVVMGLAAPWLTSAVRLSSSVQFRHPTIWYVKVIMWLFFLAEGNTHRGTLAQYLRLTLDINTEAAISSVIISQAAWAG